MQLLTVDISEEGIANDSGTLLTILLKDRTTNKNIVWASPSYEGMGKPFCADQPIKKNLIIGPYDSIIQPRVEKNKRNQELRTRKRGEVFTPPWLVDKQVSIVLDEIEDISFEIFIVLRWLELACGEGPYIVTRYDSITGDIIPVEERVGFLDRKLQRIAKEVNSEQEFIKWSKIAYESSYGYELQGDSLLLARENLLLSFCEHYDYTFGKLPTMKVIKQIATIISYNIFQMNGLTKQTPYSDNSKGNIQLNLFDDVNNQELQGDMFAFVKDWKNKALVSMDSISKGDEMMKFDVVIGNPPYQEEAQGTSTKDMPIYHKFIDSAFEIGEKACLITPARFLFNAGGTPKQWNREFLKNPHVKVPYYEQNSAKVFPNTSIKGGIAITIFDKQKDYGAIETFTSFEELNSIMKKVNVVPEQSLAEIVTNRGTYRYSDLIYKDYPDAMKRVSDRRLASNAFIKLQELFYNDIPNDGNEYIKILGRFDNERLYKWFRRDYINRPINLDRYKIVLPKANGSGAIGEVLSTPLIGEPLIGEPLIGYTETFIAIGAFITEFEAKACLKYIKGKFSRAMLGILKITQDNTKETWRKVPIQDFTPNSDIDWSQSIENIDQQLYKKYDLSQDEIDFIESKVRAMD
ncbi:MAG: Eco57I restriction-modification methylase domain-containing protein [Veillonella sp.]|uniref:Eco57I restriction-modification methylase domain-containing protein n=1 Tax=Veillonella sp. TaxID=1926307 RepID=UPI0029046EA8|nr:Eco57I restriction-modification methylase domain-containing protein [Veillonella sp.]MDU2208488.1 Eco57I restriction-modification methylase domain-containing protein [Veillonella sp.]MDU3706510.1 Eco57I restriction-modification methylase domain-containing protein [Veillonella sp.]